MEVTEQTLLDINHKHLCAMSINLKPKDGKPSDFGKGSLNPVSSKEEVD